MLHRRGLLRRGAGVLRVAFEVLLGGVQDLVDAVNEKKLHEDLGLDYEWMYDAIKEQLVEDSEKRESQKQLPSLYPRNDKFA